jgi:hypothetical protein
MSIVILTSRTTSPLTSSKATKLAESLRAAGAKASIAHEPPPALDDVDFLLWWYPGGDINPGLLADTEQYIEAFRTLLGSIDPRRVMLVGGPRGPESLKIAEALRLAGSVDEHDLWVAVTPGLLGAPPYQSGIGGRTDCLRRIGSEVEYEFGDYAKAPVAPFPSLGGLIVRYLTEAQRSN